MIRFQTLWLPLVLVLIGLLLLPLYLRLRRRARVPLCLGPYGGEPFSASPHRSFLSQIPGAFELLALLLFLFVCVSPVRLQRRTVQLDRGSDLVFVIDASPSMSARDMDGESRFEYSRTLLRTFAAAHPASSLALVSLGTTAAMRCPPTNDHAQFLAALDTLYIGEFGDGTALGLGISTALLHLSASSAPGRLIVLLTDGENNAGEIHPLTAARLAQEAGISVHVVGIGREGQALLDYTDPVSGIRRRGSFLSHYDEAALAAIAREGGGSWFKAPSPQALAEAFSSISRSTVPGGRTRDEFDKQSLFRLPLVLGLSLLVFASLLRRLFMGAA